MVSRQDGKYVVDQEKEESWYGRDGVQYPEDGQVMGFDRMDMGPLQHTCLVQNINFRPKRQSDSLQEVRVTN